MKIRTATALGLLLAGAVRAQFGLEETPSAESYSRQFVVFSPKTFVPSKYSTTNLNCITLEPALLVMSCERIKQGLARELGAETPWQGRIRIHLRPARAEEEPTTLIAERAPRGWNYRVDLPDSLERSRFLRTIVQALLLELANRNAGSHSAEIPAWLAEGLSQELLASDGVDILLPPPSRNENGLKIRRVVTNARRPNPLAKAQEELRAHAPLTFEQLSWPEAWQFSGVSGEVYRSCSQLFVNRLLRLPNGAACLRAMIADLPHRYNWQFAFLNGFKPHFPTALDVEKWWALQVVAFTGRDLTRTWGLAESEKKLDEIIRPSVNVRSQPDELPLRTEASLQTIIREWNGLEQTRVLQRKGRDLDLLRARVSQPLIALVDDYREVIGTYLQLRSLSGPFVPYKRRADAIAYSAAEQAIRRLDELDARREAMRSLLQAPVAEAAGPPAH